MDKNRQPANGKIQRPLDIHDVLAGILHDAGIDLGGQVIALVDKDVLGNDGIHHGLNGGILGSQVRVIPVIDVLGIIHGYIALVAGGIGKLHIQPFVRTDIS